MSKKQHIAIVASAHPPGDVRVFKKLVRSFANSGWQVDFIAPNQDPIPEMPSGVKFHPIQPVSGYLERFKNAKNIVGLLGPLCPSVVIFVDPELIWDMLQYKRKHLDCVVIFDRHENFNLLSKSKPGLFNYLSTLIYSQLEKYVAPRLDAVIVVLDEMKPYLHSKTFTITARNFPDRDTISKFITSTEKTTRVYTSVILGSFTANNSLMDDLHLVNELVNNRKRNSFTMLIGGNVQPNDISIAKNYISENKLGDNITLVEQRISHDQVIKHIKNSQIGICTYLNNPNLKITLHNKVLENMAAGLPVITSPSSMNQKIVQDAGCGELYWSNEIIKIADKIEYWLDNPDVAKELGLLGQKYVQENCVWEHDFNLLNTWLIAKLA